MIPKAFDDIVKEDIDALVENAVCERRDTEYKEQLPGGSERDTKEFLADVASLANASGGDLIYGVRDKRDEKRQSTGIPEAADGLAETNPVAQETRLVNMLRAGIDPRIPGVRITHIDGFLLGPVIVLRVPKSWASPHMVKDSSRFYSRTSAGKHPLDVREIRAAFTASESLAERTSAFRSDRVGKILAGETPVPLKPGPKLVLHLLPVRTFSDYGTVDLRAAQSAENKDYLKPMGHYNSGPLRFNFNGLVCFEVTGTSRPARSYVELFRNGAIEAVSTWLAEAQALAGCNLNGHLREGVRQYAELQKRLGVGPPGFIAISAVFVKGFTILPAVEHPPAGQPSPSPIDQDVLLARFGRPSLSPVDQDVLLAPEVLVEEEEVEVERLLRPALDTIWQASGWPGSPGYNESGKYVGFSPYQDAM